MRELKTVSARLNWNRTKAAGNTNFAELNLITSGWKILIPENKNLLVKSIHVHSFMNGQTANSESIGYLTKFECIVRPLDFSGQRKFQGTPFSGLNVPAANTPSPATAFRVDALTHLNPTLEYCEICGGIEFERISIVQNGLLDSATSVNGNFYVTIQYYID